MKACAMIVLALLLGSPPAEASSFREVSLGELVETSHAVIQVKVLGTESAWTTTEYSYIATTAHLKVVRSLRGSFERGEELMVREAGGQVGNDVVQAIGFPQLREGQELVIFLTRWEDETGDWRINGYGQGILEVDRSIDGKARLVPAQLQGESPNQTETLISPVVLPMSTLESFAQTLKLF